MSNQRPIIPTEEGVKSQLRRGVLEYCILSILAQGDSYAPRIISELKLAEMIIVEGTIYPLLTRQKNAGLLDYRWEESTQGPPRKVYSLTEKGFEALSLFDKAWGELTDQVSRLRGAGFMLDRPL